MSQFVVVLLAFAAFLGAVQANPTNRILNGDDANFKQFAHQISLRFTHRHNCGGSIISRRSILTAAHCVVNGTEILPAELFSIRAGTINRVAGGVIVGVKNIKLHPSTDVALLELDENLTFSEHIQPIEMLDEEVPDNSDVIISGWGLTVHQGAGSPIYLQYRHVTAISKKKCARKIAQYKDSLLCLDHKSGDGACNGDSGGPATYNGKLAGVAGFVVVKCGAALPDGYAKVSYNINWIRENMV